MRRIFQRGPILLIGLVAGASLLVSSTQTWLMLTLVDGRDAAIPGSSAMPALVALSLAALAAFAACSIAGAGMLRVMGVLAFALAVCMVIGAWAAILSPVSAGSAEVGAMTGVAGSASLAELVSTHQFTAWPAITIVVAVLVGFVGLAIVTLARGWAVTSRSRSLFTVRTDGAAPDPHRGAPTGVDDAAAVWDSMTEGDDPTRRGRPDEP